MLCVYNRMGVCALRGESRGQGPKRNYGDTRNGNMKDTKEENLHVDWKKIRLEESSSYTRLSLFNL